MSAPGNGDVPGGASADAIRAHYDIGNPFFRAWLDESMTYSAARWSNGDRAASSLEEAQNWKLDWHLSSTDVRPGQRLLEVGCGWGSLLLRAAETRRIGEAVGLTPSAEQAALIPHRAEGAPIAVVRSTWKDAKFQTPFDAIVSIEALEAFAKPGLNSDDRRLVYQDFFQFCFRNLVPGGRLSLQFISWMDIPAGAEDKHLPVKLFPESALPHTLEVLQASDGYFNLLDLENRPGDYSRTLQDWLRRIHEKRDALIDLEGKDRVKRFIRDFRRFIVGFEAGTLGLVRLSLKARTSRNAN